MRKLLLLLLSFLSVTMVIAQNRTISGTVTDEKGSPLVGVTISVKGTSIATQSKDDGTFSLAVPNTAKTLVFSTVGYANREVTLGTSNVLNATLTQQANEMKEVVVTALGIVKDKRALGYATQTLKNDQIANKGEPNLINALQGKVAGVTITSASGSPGSSSNINIRGITSFLGSNQPLFIVDGIPVSNDVDRTTGGPISTLGDQQPPNRILDLNLNNIESVNILKGPAAAALYGSRASAGAIVITTKKGSSARGKVDITLNSSYGFQNQNGLPEFQTEYGQGLNGVFNSISGNSFGPKFGTTPTLVNGLINANGTTNPYQLYADNIKDFFETGHVWDNNLSINMGDASQNATLSLGNFDQKGILPATSLNRTSVTFGAGAQMNKVRISGSATYTSTVQNGILGGNSAGGGSGFAYLVNVPRSVDLRSFKNNYKNPDGTQNWPLITNGIENPYFTAYENPVKSNLSRVLGNITMGYDIASWLNVSYRFGVDAYTDRRKQIFAVNSRVVPKGLVLEDVFYRSELNGDLNINAKKNDIFIDGLNATVLLGHNVNQRKFQNVSSKGDDLTIPGYYNLNNAATFSNGTGEVSTLRRLLGYYGQISLDWNNYLFLELTGRMDESSTLAPGKNRYFYPSVATSFVFTDALKIESDAISYGKIRLSAAKVGRDADPYLLENTFAVSSFGNNVAGLTFPVSNITGFSVSGRIANEDIKPEFTTSYEAGLNLGFFKNRLSIDVAYFDEVSKDQIINVAVPTSTGFTTRTANVGKMTNKGVELMINATPVSTRNFKWDVTANYTRIRNEVVEIFEGIQNFPIASGQSFGGVIASIAVGQPYGVIIGNKLPRSPDGQYLINPATGLFQPGVPNSVVADPNPDYTAGINNNFRFKNITLGFLFDMTYGGDLYSFTIPAMRSGGLLKETAVDRELPMILPGVIQTAPDKYIANNIQIPAQTYWRAGGLSSELSVFDATVVKLRELTLSFDLPSTILQKTPLSAVRLGVFGRNLWYYAPNFPMDPEVNTQGAGNLRGLDLQGAPNARTIGASLRVSFK